MRRLSLSLLLMASSLIARRSAYGALPAAPARREPTAAIHTISVRRPNIEVTGSHLARVEIWIEPTGTGVEEARVGEAKRTTPAGNHEKWVFPISSLPGYPRPVMAVNILAKGYNSEGKAVGGKSLGLIGVTSLNKALYGRTPE